MSFKSKSNKSENSETESFIFKIETQKSSELKNSFTGKQDEREIARNVYQSRMKSRRDRNNQQNQYLIAILIVVILCAVYYAMIIKSRRGVLLTKVYHSFCLLIISIIDRFLNFDQYDNLFIIDEEYDESLKQDLLDSNYSNNNSRSDINEIRLNNEENLINKSYNGMSEIKISEGGRNISQASPNNTNTNANININTNSDFNHQPVKKGFSKNEIMMMMIALGFVSFFCELITFSFIKRNNDENLGILFCLLSYEYIMVKIYNYKTLSHNLNLPNILGLLGIYFSSITLNLIFFDQVNMYYSLIISSLRFIRYYIQIKLKNQFTNVVLLSTIITDLSLGLACFFGLLYSRSFHLISFSNLIIIFFASSCYYFYLKNYKIFDLTVYAFTYPALGIVDLIINNRTITFLSLFCMMIVSGVVLLTFQGDTSERSIFSFRNNEFNNNSNLRLSKKKNNGN